MINKFGIATHGYVINKPYARELIITGGYWNNLISVKYRILLKETFEYQISHVQSVEYRINITRTKS